MRTWIFQGNPKLFDMEGYLAASAGLITWTVSNYADQIFPGDSVYIWQSQGEDPALAGIVAEGTITEHPSIQKNDPLSVDFWRQPEEHDERMRVRIRLNRIATKREILKREWMKDDSVLRSLSILRLARGTNFPVEEPEAKRLGHLWQKTGRDWERDEVIAALYLYEQLRDKPISNMPDSEVERLAQQIGRVRKGVYSKLMNLRSIDPRDSRKGLEGGSKVDQLTWNEFFNEATSALNLARLSAEYERLWGGGVKSYKSEDEVFAAEERRLAEKPLEWLLSQYASRPQNVAPRRRSQESIAYDRDQIVVALRKRLASNRCEVAGCQSEQFRTESGELFIEVHHLIPLADGGPDTLENTAAVCPTHHRLLHHGIEWDVIAAQLFQKRQSERAAGAQ
jgi:predicted RNA-binding protein with PUA-like domain